MENIRIVSRRFAGSVMYLSVAAVLVACGTVDKVGDWWRGGTVEAPRLAPGVGEYFCDGGKSFQARFDAATRSAWVRFPDREFRLDAVPDAAEGRYSNGRTTLNSKGDEASLTEGATLSYTNCKRAG